MVTIIVILSVIGTLIATPFVTTAQYLPGDFDASFDMSIGANGTVYAVMALDDGKLLVGGEFTTIQGVNVPHLARLNADGTVDDTFDTGSGPNAAVRCMLPYDTDKYLVAGEFTEFDGSAEGRMVAVNNDGSRYMDFQSPLDVNDAIYCLEYSGGGILVGGTFTTPTFRIFKTAMNGDADVTFNTNVGLGIDGTLTPGVFDIHNGPGYIIIAGSFTSYDGNGANYVARLNPDGTIDTFEPNGSGMSGPIWHIEPLPEVGNPMILCGGFIEYAGNTVYGAVKVASDLSFIEPATQGTGFTGADPTVRKMLLQPDGKFYAIGNFDVYNAAAVQTMGIVRMNSDYSVDEEFVSLALTTPGEFNVYDIAQPWDGRVIVAGDFNQYDGNTTNNLLRIYGDSCLSRLMGTVTLEGQPVTDGKVYVYAEQLAGAGYAIVDSTDIMEGAYFFPNLEEFPVTYILQAVPDQQAYPASVAVPTFFSPDGPSHKWNDPALTYSLNSTCGNIDTINITVLQPESSSAGPGSGSISGQLRWAENKVAAEDPIPIIDIVVERVPPGNSVFAYTQTDAQGNYSFTDLPLTADEDFVYGIHVSIPGIPMQNTYLVSITEEGQTFTDLDFLADTIQNIIYPVGNTQVGIESPESTKIFLFPIPVHDRLTTTLPQHVHGTVTAEVFDLSGRTLLRKDGLSAPTFTLDCNGLAAGMHLLRITDREGRTFNSEFMVSHR